MGLAPQEWYLLITTGMSIKEPLLSTRPWWKSRLVKRCAVILAIAVLLFLFRFPILRCAGNYLISEDPLAHADVVFVLGGSATDRGEEAAKLYFAGLCDRFVCTGKNVPGDLQEVGIDLSESDMTKLVVQRCGVPADRIESFKEGTSTQEEAIALLDREKATGVDTVIIVSHGFHLRRVRNVFENRFNAEGITVLLHGAESRDFSHDAWWRTEQGMMMVQNEYAKLLYYLVKH